MWGFDLPRRADEEKRLDNRPGFLFDRRWDDDNLLSDLSPGQRIAVWFHASGFIEGQFEGFQRGYALFIVNDTVMRIRVNTIQAIAFL